MDDPNKKKVDAKGNHRADNQSCSRSCCIDYCAEILKHQPQGRKPLHP